MTGNLVPYCRKKALPDKGRLFKKSDQGRIPPALNNQVRVAGVAPGGK